MSDATGKQWYLIQCKPRQALRALENLERQHYQCLLPMHQVERLHKGKLQVINEPLFPGYLFIHLDKLEDNWLPIRSTRGVNHIVSFGGLPTPIEDETIHEIIYRKSIIAPALRAGDQVLISDIGMRQIEAIFLEHSGEERVLLLLNLLQRKLSISIPINRIERLET